MTTVPVENNSPIVTLVATAGQTAFDFGFLIQTAAQLQVIRTPVGGGTPVTLALDVDYTVPVSAIGTNSGGSITLTAGSFPTGATEGDLFTLSREIPIIRQTAFPFRGSYNANSINFQLDTIFLVLQELERDDARALSLNVADSLSSVELPLDSVRRGRFLAFEDTDTAPPIASAGPAGSTPVSSFIEPFLTSSNEASAQNFLGLSAGVRNLEATLASQVFC